MVRSSEGAAKLKHLDIMGPPIQIKMGGFSGLKSYFGLLMTAVYICSIFGLGWFIVGQFFDTSLPQVSREVKNTGLYPAFDMLKNETLPVAYFFKNGTERIPADQVRNYYSLKFVRKVKKYSKESTHLHTVSSIATDVVPCREAKKSALFSSYFRFVSGTDYFGVFGEEFGLCVGEGLDDLSVQGGGTDQEVTTLAFTIYPCSAGAACVTSAERETVTFSFSIPGVSVDISQQTSPTSKYMFIDQQFGILAQFSQHSLQRLTTTRIIDDPGLYLSLQNRAQFSSIIEPLYSLRTRNASQVECSEADIQNNYCSMFFEVEFISSGFQRTIFRSYKGFVEMLGDIGGVNEIVFILCLYANWFYLRSAGKRILVEKVFDFFGQPEFQSKRQLNLHAKPDEKINNKLSLQDQDWPVPPKPTLQEADRIDLQSNAFKMINETLDIVTIVHEINNIKLITKALLKDYQEAIAPLVILGMLSASKKTKKSPYHKDNPVVNESSWTPSMERVTSASAQLPRRRVGSSRPSIILEKTTITECIKKAYLNSAEPSTSLKLPDCRNEADDWEESIGKKVDGICCKSLTNAGVLITEILKNVAPQPGVEMLNLKSRARNIEIERMRESDSFRKVGDGEFEKVPDSVGFERVAHSQLLTPQKLKVSPKKKGIRVVKNIGGVKVGQIPVSTSPLRAQVSDSKKIERKKANHFEL